MHNGNGIATRGVGALYVVMLAMSQSAFAQTIAYCWIDAKTGEQVPTVPRGATGPLCVWPWPVTVTFGVDGHDFDPNGAQVVASYIYFVDHHGKFRTDWHGKDSRVAAIMLQRSPTHLLFTVDLAQIHQTAADHFGTFAGNYYVQVQNPNGKLSDGPMFFTVQPYHGPGMTHC